ncbi:D-amino-acid transaminase [Beijerinckia indica]|uniref:Probable branched-chain-amino-acid aminotransferase n=1 Tax=Beijerinckia indica subsp. indica (strain ATCC 9039 / DSM 1715 / NCIMB 8712) TaxID=395963 RepID=B2IB73_BEII9|nr:D-amino-acid transaminase [Beijerinckia indica]ACB95157.1 aminotransferase class IV [Beijerinckia indica subsp. indica ATCC 9039]
MSRIFYLNGRYLPREEAHVSVEDRGYLFGDGVYEVLEIHRGALIDEDRHWQRLDRSLSELRISWPIGQAAFGRVLREVKARNKVENGFLYIQITRGAAPREHVFPAQNVRPSLLVSARPVDPRKGEAQAQKGIGVISLPDLRWKRVDIKTINLLPNVLAKQAAKEEGATEAWLFDEEGLVTEGAASNAWIIDENRTIHTHPVDHSILRGITRTTLIDIIAAKGYALKERRFSLAEARAAREAFITGALSLVMPVVRIDGKPIGEGVPGPIATELRRIFHDTASRTL